MKNSKLLTISFISMIISACGGMPKEEMMIQDLSVETIKYEPAKPTIADPNNAIKNYKAFLNNASNKEQYGAALRRLADLEMEIGEKKNAQSDQANTTEGQMIMLSSIEHYETYLDTYPGHAQNDLVLYQLAKAHSYNGDYEKALEKMNLIVQDYPATRYIDEVQFRRGEILFVMGDYDSSEKAYTSIVRDHLDSQYYEKALYKLGWSQFKQSKYLKALANYLHLLDRKQAEGKLTPTGLVDNLSRADQDFINDTLRVVSLALSYKQGAKTIEALFSSKANRTYEALLYRQLAELYLKKERASDAADVYLDFGRIYPTRAIAAEFHTLAIEAYKQGNFHDLVLASKVSFVNKYGVATPFWQKQNQQGHDLVKPHLKKHIRELATHYHAGARKSKKEKDYSLASVWYQKYITSFPEDPDMPIMNFLLAETLYDAKQYDRALNEYEKTAYSYPDHKKSAEAGYAALLTYDTLLNTADNHTRPLIKTNSINSAIRFSNKFPHDKHAPAVITKTSEELFAIRNYPQASEFAKRVIDREDIKDKKLKKTAWTVYAHSQFELKDFAAAELAYIEVLKRTPKKEKEHKALSDKLAASIYKQAEQQRDETHYSLAAFHFLRIGKIVPSSPIRATAEYDAATMHIKLQEWDKATSILENFRRNFPKHDKFSKGVTEKLAMTYTESGQFSKAAKEIAVLAAVATTTADKQSLLWQSAEMYEKAGNTKKANDIYIQYINKYPKPFPQYIEAHQLVSDYYLKSKQWKPWGSWLKKTVKAESNGSKHRTARTNLIAATATMHLTKPVIKRFKQAKLTVPLKKSLKVKKRYMKEALTAYANVISYQIAELTTESTYHVAEIYNHFSKALMNSQRPKGLNAEELEQYDILLEEQAYPFEEKAIEIHSSNTQRTKDGIFDKWVKKSLKLLAQLQPIRYAKTEKIENYAAIAN